MGCKFIKNLDGIDYNRKLFHLDNGAADLPVIKNTTDIMPGSEAHDLGSTDMWVLNSNYVWTKSPWKE